MPMIKALPVSMIEVLPDVIPNNDPQVQSNEVTTAVSVKISQAHENGELPTVKYMREISYGHHPSTRKERRKRESVRSRAHNPEKGPRKTFQQSRT